MTSCDWTSLEDKPTTLSRMGVCQELWLLICFQVAKAMNDSSSSHETTNALQREEVKLARSNKKVKDIHHVEFNGAVREDSPPIDNLCLDPQTRASVKEKLIGEILGAYAEAFDLTDQMEKDMEVEKEIEDNRDLVGPGRVAVKLS